MADQAFDPGWLGLREAADHRSRAGALLDPLRDAWRTRGWRRILDLGCGTGSNLRYLAPRLPPEQEWTLLDRDPTLLAHVELPASPPPVELVRGDLVKEGIEAVSRANLVTASALLDLASADWIHDLVDACRETTCGAFFALTYDGRIRWRSRPDNAFTSGPGSGTDSGDSDDELVRAAINAHQLRNKGLGPALGPAAAHEMEKGFREAGYRTWMADSPWRLGPGDAELSRALIVGWARAAIEEKPEEAARVQTWAARRCIPVAEPGFELLVGHVDLLALPLEG